MTRNRQNPLPYPALNARIIALLSLTSTESKNLHREDNNLGKKVNLLQMEATKHILQHSHFRCLGFIDLKIEFTSVSQKIFRKNHESRDHMHKTRHKCACSAVKRLANAFTEKMRNTILIQSEMACINCFI